MTCLKPKPNPHCFLRPTEKVFGREVLWRLETVYLVDIASDSSKQAQLEASYLLASRSLVKCLLVLFGLDPLRVSTLYPIDCDRERERETLYIYPIALVLSSSMFAIIYHPYCGWLISPFFFVSRLVSRHQLAGSSPAHPLVVPPEGLLGPSGCRSRHRLPGLESHHGRASERLPGLCAVGTPGHVAG